jgi:hypothetical protein
MLALGVLLLAVGAFLVWGVEDTATLGWILLIVGFAVGTLAAGLSSLTRS